MLQVKTKDGNEFPIAFHADVRQQITDLAWLYEYMYDEVYHCWENAVAQTMIAKALEEVVYSSRFLLSDLLRLTDVELFAALEEFENPIVNELAWLVKYRRFLDFGVEIQFDSTNINEADLQRHLGLNDGTFNLLATARNPKHFSATFAWQSELPGVSNRFTVETVKLVQTLGKVFLFHWPTANIDLRANLERVNIFIQSNGGRVRGHRIGRDIKSPTATA